MMATLALTAGVTLVKGVGPLLYITENYVQLISAAIAMSLAQVSALNDVRVAEIVRLTL